MMNSKIVIIGGGFAGRQACRALRSADTEVILFDPRSSTVMLPALPDLAGGWLDENLLHYPLKKLLPSTVRHIQKSVRSIDLAAKTLIAGSETFEFDCLLVAAGFTTLPMRLGVARTKQLYAALIVTALAAAGAAGVFLPLLSFPIAWRRVRAVLTAEQLETELAAAPQQTAALYLIFGVLLAAGLALPPLTP